MICLLLWSAYKNLNPPPISPTTKIPLWVEKKAVSQQLKDITLKQQHTSVLSAEGSNVIHLTVHRVTANVTPPP